MAANAAYEAQARSELTAWRERMMRPPSAVESAAKVLQGRVNALIPDKVHAAVTKAIEAMVRGMMTGSDWTTPPPARDLTLREREDRVRKAIASYRNVAAVEGGVTGAGGFLLAAADFPAWLAIKVKLLFEIAALYGHDAGDWRERMFILSIFQLAFSGADSRRELLGRLERGDFAEAPEDFDWRRFQIEYRDYIDLAKLAQLLPVIGAPVGAVVNWRLTEKLGETAMNAYRLRRLGAH